MIYNFDNRTMDLYGKAKVNYQNMIIQGPKISVDDKTSMVNANASTDSLGKPLELPVFTDRSGSFSAETMQYNFKTKKGRTSSVSSVVGEGLYTGEQVTRLSTGELYLKEGIYTTCNDPEPHYWFAGKNMKLIPKDKMVARPVVMYIHPEILSHRLPIVPLLPLPFMSMSINRERASGFLLPKFARDSSRGFYLSDIGYFFAINDYMDLRLESDLAFNGSWRAAERFRYSKRYLYTGSVAAEYSRYQLNHPGDPEFDQFSNWNAKILHHQDFDPTTRLDLNLMYQGGRRNYDMNSINIESIINEQVTSNASFYKSFDEGERVLTGSYQRIKNLTTEDATQTLNVSLYQNKIYPFRPRKWSIDQSDWRSRLSVNPSASLTGQFSNVSAVETDNYAANASVEVGYQQDIARGYKASVYQGLTLQQLYRTNDLDENRSGSMVQLPFKIQSTLFNYLYLNPSLTFSQYRVNSTISRIYDPLTASTLTRNIDEKMDYSTAVFTVDAQTRMYGILNTGFLENLIGLKAIRHTLYPDDLLYSES